MAGNLKINIEKPTTQSIDAVKALLQWRGRASDPLPQFVEIGSGESKVVLILSNKRDSYYTTTKTDCSCPASVYHHGPCKHQRKHFAEYAAPKTAPKAAGADLIPRQQFKPFIEDEARPAKVAPSSSLVPLVGCLGDANNREVAYQEMKFDREMWPMVA